MKTKPGYLTIGSFLLPLILLCTLWTSLHLAPFGDNNLLVSDLGTQYMPFLNFMKRSIEEGHLAVYSFSNEIGAPIVALAAYYLLSPFNLLIFFCSYAQVPIAILWIITLKISLSGTTMFYYLKKTYGTAHWSTLLFSTAYSFCGFVTVYSQNFMWLDALLLFPLVVLGVQRLWTQKKWGLYACVLFGAIVTNYYLGYMICLFVVIYSGYWLISKQALRAYPLKELLQNVRLFLVVSCLTGLSASFVLLPAAEGMLQTKKTNIDLSSFFLTPQFGTSFFSQFGIGSINYELRLEHLPTIFTGLLVLMLCVAYFQMNPISRRRKLSAAAILALVFASFWLKGFATIWHMFQSPAGFPYRNAFMLSFLLIIFACEAFQQMQQGTHISWSVPVVVSLLLLIGYSSLYYGPQKNLLLSFNYLIVSIVFVWLFYGIICLVTIPSFKKTALVLLFCFVSAELGVNYWISLKDIPFGSQAAYQKNYQQQSALIETQLAQDPTLYRNKQVMDSTQAGYREKNNGYNNPFLYGYAGVSSYTSTLTTNTQDILSDLGLYQKNDRRIAYVDSSQVVNLLLNVRYEFLPNDRINHLMPIKTAHGINVIQHPEAIGMGFLTDQHLTANKWIKNQPLRFQEQVLQQLVPSKEPYYKEASVVAKTQKTADTIELTAKVNTSGNFHLFIPGLNWSEVQKFKINGKVITPPIYIATKQLFNLGYYPKGTIVTITLTTKQVADIATWQLQTLDQAKFDQAVASLRQHPLELVAKNDGQLTGNITVPKKGPSLLFTSIPYDSNWSVVSKQAGKLKKQKVLGNFLALELPPGQHTLTFTYRSKVVYWGLAISVSVWLSTAFVLIFKNRTRFFFRRKKGWRL